MQFTQEIPPICSTDAKLISSMDFNTRCPIDDSDHRGEMSVQFLIRIHVEGVMHNNMNTSI